jgi:SRSO17 transposase
MIERAVADGLPRGVVLADCDYGNKAAFRDALDTLGLQYAVEVQSNTMVSSCVGNTGRLGDRMSVGELGAGLKSKLRTITWRQGSKAVMRSRFARLRVVVDRDDRLRPPQWLLIEWPEGEPAPTKFVLSTVPPSVSCTQLVRTFKERWRIERSYEDLKGELGLDHYEGRSYIGWHHHVSVVLACYAFLVAEHARSFPPSARRARHTRSITHAA